MSLPSGFAEKVASYSDVQLANILNTASDYTPEALAVVVAEWDRRRLTADAVAPALAAKIAQEQSQAIPSPTRPQAIKGIGLICYGRDYKGLAGYITTQWFCIFAVPVFPIRSFHVHELATGVIGKVDDIARHKAQVVRTYLFLISIVALASAALWIFARFGNMDIPEVGLAIVVGSVLVPMFCLQLSRRNARQRTPNQSITAQRASRGADRGR